MKITILGRTPSKKNSKQIFINKGKLLIMPSANYKQWHKDASRQLVGSFKKSLCPPSIQITFFAPDRRKSDLTNKAESIMDLLVDNGVLQDDNWDCVPEVVLKYGGYDKANPRAVVELLTK